MNTLRSVIAVLHSTPGDKATEGTSVIYQITRYEIENCLIDRIVQDLRGANKKPLCRCAMGEMTFIVEGYDDDQRELFQILEFRRYIQQASKHEIPWIYYASIESLWIQVVALSIFDNAAAITDAVKQRTKMLFYETDVSEFLMEQRVAFNALCETSGVSQKDAEKRVQDVLKRFGNPLQK